MSHVWHQYAADVAEGRIVTGSLVRFACERHLRDMAHGKERGLWFDEDEAARTVKFFAGLRHSKGEWAGKPFLLEPWNQFQIASVFGWKREDGFRRFRQVYDSQARKNGKSTKGAGIGLKLFAADKEPGAEVYTAATHREQARIVHSEAIRMVRQTGPLKRRFRIVRDNISWADKDAKYQPLGADADTLDGLNPHGIIIDELHAHKSRAMLDVMETGTGSRRQPLLWIITTAGSDRTSVCYLEYDYARRVVQAVDPSEDGFDDTYFAYVAELDETDDWQDEALWIKSNPNLGVSVKLDDLRRKAHKAKHSPAYENTFRRLHLNQWTEQSSRFLSMEVWDDQPPLVPEAELMGHPLFVGMDLAYTSDITALVGVFPLDDGTYQIRPRFFVPEDQAVERSASDRVKYQQWIAQGFMTATEGNITDYKVIRIAMGEDAARFALQEIPYDPYNATQLVTQLQDDDGLTCVEMRQGFITMNAPTQTLLRLALGRKLRHGGHPVLRWMMSNLVVKTDPAGNVKPDKAKATEKIDGAVALIMALGRATVVQPESSGVEVW